MGLHQIACDREAEPRAAGAAAGIFGSLLGLGGGILIVPLLTAGRSPHVMYRPSEIPITLDDVVGLGTVRDEVVKTLNLFLAFRTFRDRMGGNPRRAILFEGPPGTGKTEFAKVVARGLVPIVTPESGFDSPDAIYLTRYASKNKDIIAKALEMKEDELVYRSTRIMEKIRREHSWDKFYDTIAEHINRTAT